MTQETTTYLPVGAFQFKLKPVPQNCTKVVNGVTSSDGCTAEFKVNLPAGALC